MEYENFISGEMFALMTSDEIVCLKNLLDNVQKGDVCVDVGANKGFFSEAFLKKLNGTGKVYSIELMDFACEKFANKFGHWPNVRVINCAVSEEDGICKYYFGVDDSTNNIIGHTMGFDKCKEGGEIASRKLDTILSEEKNVKLIKIDVEGAENMVLKGMTETFKKTEYVFIECHLDKDWEETLEIMITRNNFEVYDASNLEKISIGFSRRYHILCKNPTI